MSEHRLAGTNFLNFFGLVCFVFWHRTKKKWTTWKKTMIAKVSFNVTRERTFQGRSDKVIASLDNTILHHLHEINWGGMVLYSRDTIWYPCTKGMSLEILIEGDLYFVFQSYCKWELRTKIVIVMSAKIKIILVEIFWDINLWSWL